MDSEGYAKGAAGERGRTGPLPLLPKLRLLGTSVRRMMPARHPESQLPLIA
jgi:hypothetical protein